jgi:hypothetical protein
LFPKEHEVYLILVFPVLFNVVWEFQPRIMGKRRNEAGNVERNR